MSHWNYRVMRRTYENEVSYSIHEVYYNDDGKATGWTQDESGPFGESIEELIRDFESIRKATLLPVLDFESGLPIESG